MNDASQSKEAEGLAPAPQEVACPQCGGDNSIPTGSPFLTCSFCDATLFLDRARVVGHFTLPRLLDEAKAASALRRWMAGNETVKNLDKKSRVEALSAVTFPMWLFRTGGKGREETFMEPAAPTPIPSLADLEVPAGKLVPYTGPEAGAEAMPPMIPLETARGWLEQRGAGKVVENSLVEVPLWRARYSYDGKEFRALVEASTGRVLASVFPEKAESPYVLVAILGLFVFGLLGLAITNPIFKAVAYAFAAVPLSLLAWWVTRKV